MHLLLRKSKLKYSLFPSSVCRLSALSTLIFLSLFCIIGGHAYATTYYIAPGGNDGNAGTSAAPWASFTQAMTVLQPGDTLYLEDGTYSQPLYITLSGTSSNVIYFKALNEGNAYISTNYPNSALVIGDGISYVEIDGINFRNSGQYDSNTLCATDGENYSAVHGINIGRADHVTLRRVTSNGSSGCNSAVISLAGTTNSLLEDCAGSGQGRVVLNMLGCNDIVVRRCWLNWTGPTTGGGDTEAVTQIYDSSNVLLENNIGVNFTSTSSDFFGTWAHYSSLNGDTLLGNIGYSDTETGRGLSDTAECGFVASGTQIINNVSLFTGPGGEAATEVNADPKSGTIFKNNTFVGSNGQGSGIHLSYRTNCPSQQAAVANVYNNSFINLSAGIDVDSTANNYVEAHDYNNFYNVTYPLYNPFFLTPAGFNAHEYNNSLNPSYNTSTYGPGAYLMVPAALKGLGAGGADLGASILYEYVNGTLTNTPLWPWPMEARIVGEFGVSPTWEIAGGLWKTLDGVYPTSVFFASNSGGGQYTDKTGVVYQADMDYSGGSPASTTAVITGTPDSTLYQSERYGNFSYNVPLANGNYTVTLKFAEIYWNAAGQRIFNVSMQGAQVISNLDIFAKVGKNAAYDISVPVSVANGMLNINFTSVIDYACLNAIVITTGGLEAEAPTVPGAPTGVTATSGNASAIVTFSAPVSNGGRSITGYSVTSSPAGGVDNSVGTTANTHIITGLSNGTAYTFTVTATNTIGTGGASTPSNSVIPLSSGPMPASVAFAVNSGGMQYTSQSGVVYNADMDYSGGSTASVSATITGTLDSYVYQSERYGNFSYNIPLGNGTYIVTLKFAEIYWNAVGQRVFNVSMQGVQVISNLDIFAKAGYNAAYDVSIPVSVTNGVLNINFMSVVDNAKVSAIVLTASPILTVPGAPTGVTATAGNASATVTFTAPLYNGGSSITGYTVTSNPAGGVDRNSGTTATTHVITGLTNGTAYTFTVTATNAAGTGGVSAPSNSVIPSIVPGAPTGVTATAGNASATVTFTAPIYNGGSSITGYTVTSNPAGGVDSNAGTTATTHGITGLTNGTAYSFAVTATNAAGTGVASTPSNSVIPSIVPGAPTGVTATAGNASATVAFTAPASNGGSLITGYAVSSNPAGGVDINAGTTTTTHGISGLNNGTAYTFTVTATNAAGTGGASTPSNSVIPLGVPGAPTGVTATAGIASATVTFTAPASNGGRPITGYAVSSNPAGGLDNNAGTTATTHVISGLNNGTAYTFTVTATNAAGTGGASTPSNSITPATVPGAPTGVTAAAGNASATVTFTAPIYNGGSSITGYTVTSNPAGGVDSNAGTTATTHGITGLNNGTAYTFTVTAANTAGTGGASAPSNSVTPLGVPGAPTGVTATAGIASATVTFTAPASNGGSLITGYFVSSNPAGGVDLNAGTTATTHVITSLNNGTAYTFTVTATNTAGTGGASAPSNSVTPLGVPGAPAGVTATAGNASATVTFTAPTYNGGSSITGYAATSNPPGGVDSNAGTTATTHVITSLNNGTAYTFTVTAANVVGKGAASTPSSSVTPATVPGAPTGASAAAGNASATVTFTAPASNGGSSITGYTATSNPPGGVDSNAGTTATTHVITGLNNGTAYTFTVTAANAVGTGGASMPSNSVVPFHVVFAANAGGGQYTDKSGVVYQSDTAYSGGSTASTTAAITGTTDPTLYQSERYGNFSYNVPLANGIYIVTLKFAEIYWNSAGQRVFNVSMQGLQVISNLDIIAKVGKNAAYDVSIPVSVTNGILNINFTTIVDNAKVGSIEVTNGQASPQPPPAAGNAVFAVHAGGGQYTDKAGVVYQSDMDYTSGSKASTTAAITGTTDPTLYQSERYGNFFYNVPLANGSYMVTLKFAEIYWNAAGQRVFNVSMQGIQVISNLDIFAQVGKNAAYDVSIPVSVTNGTLNINFTSLVDNAKVSAIKVTLN